MGAVVVNLFVLAALVGAVVWYRRLPPERREEMAEQARERRRLRQERLRPKQERGHVGHREKITEMGDRSSGTLACPRCGSTQFTAKRSMKGKMAAGVLAPKTQVRCVACGAMFKRG